MDKLILKNLQIGCKIGVTEKERRHRQKNFVDLEFFLDTVRAARSDDIKNTVDYSSAAGKVMELAEKNEFRLIEALAEKIAVLMLKNFAADAILVRVRKPRALKNCEYASVEILRKR